jgi:hypothetical protein
MRRLLGVIIDCNGLKSIVTRARARGSLTKINLGGALESCLVSPVLMNSMPACTFWDESVVH